MTNPSTTEICSKCLDMLRERAGSTIAGAAMVWCEHRAAIAVADVYGGTVMELSIVADVPRDRATALLAEFHAQLTAAGLVDRLALDPRSHQAGETQ